MKESYIFLKKAAVLFLLVNAHIFLTSAQAVENDPDLPPGHTGAIDKEEYLIERGRFYSDQRNTLPRPMINPRIAAIEKMRGQEQLQHERMDQLTITPNWIQLGPSPIPNGQTTTNLVAVSGRTTAIAIHPANENIVYIGTANGGVYRTTNGGTSWTAIFDAGQSLAIGALALAPSDPTILYVGTGEPQLSADSYLGVGLYRINNADASPVLNGPINPGITYTDLSANAITSGAFSYRAISKILVDPSDPAKILVSTSTATAGNPTSLVANPYITSRLGLYRSVNATASTASVAFTKITVTTAGSLDNPNTGSRSVMDMVMEPGTPNNVLAYVRGNASAGDGGIYRTTNAFAATPTFTQVRTTAFANSRGELAINKSGGVVTVYAGTGESSTGTGLLIKSKDGGVTWTSASGSYDFCAAQCFYDIAVEMDPIDSSVLYVGGSSGSVIFRYTTNGGTSFTASNTNLHADVHVIKVAPSNTNVLYFGCDGGIWKSTNKGVNWTSMNTAGYHATQFQSIALHPVDPKFTVGGTQDNGTIMQNPDGTFRRIDGGDGGYAVIDQNATNTTNVTIYHTYFNNSTQAGFARTDVASGTGTLSFPFYGCGGTANGITCPPVTLFYSPLALGPGNPNTVYFGTNVLYRSVNKGVTMTLASQNPVESGVAISTIAVSPLDDNFRIIGLRNGKVYSTSTGADSLVNITPAGAPSTPASRVIFDPVNKNVAYLSYGGYLGVVDNRHVYKTINFNALTVTWTASGSGLPDVPVNSLAIHPASTSILYAATDIGVYISIDGGATWASYSSGLPVVPIFDIAVHPVSKTVRIATHGRGFWETGETILPVGLNLFTATPKPGGKVYLEWFTATEQNNKGFNVERMVLSGNGPNLKWETVGFVTGFGTSSSQKHYDFTDLPVGGKRFVYRLKQVDFDNQFKYSDERQIDLKGFDFALFPVYPNPVSQAASIRYQVTENIKVVITLFQADGHLIRQLVNENREAGIYQVNFDVTDLPAGTYFYKLEAGKLFDTKRFVISRK